LNGWGHKKSFACFASLRFNFKLNSNKKLNTKNTKISNQSTQRIIKFTNSFEQIVICDYLCVLCFKILGFKSHFSINYKKIFSNILLISILVILISCQSNSDSSDVKEKINELTINTNTVNSNSSKNNQLEELFIKPPADSSFTGNAEEKYPNGIVKYKGFYRFGKRHGEWLFFYPNGLLWSECTYNRGKMNGKSNVYHPNGKLYYSGYYKNDLKDSIWVYYDTSGNEVMLELYKNNQLIKRMRK
jgi:antitoxin component YwqK of YwqJK toxin-antitoxin module